MIGKLSTFTTKLKGGDVGKWGNSGEMDIILHLWGNNRSVSLSMHRESTLETVLLNYEQKLKGLKSTKHTV